MAETVLRAENVAKRYGPVVALRDVTLSVEAGEVHALLGANGAGKSTLVKILTGVIRQDQGTISVHGEAMAFSTPEQARAAGIVSVFQDPALAPDLTVSQNMRLTGTPLDAFRTHMAAFGLADIALNDQIRDIPLTAQRMIDLARALCFNPKVLLLDEITAALPADLSAKVFEVMAERRASGRSVLFITHRLGEVLEHADRATILRDGTDVQVTSTVDASERQLVTAMVGDLGEDLASSRSGDHRNQPVVLRATNLAAGGRLKDVTLTLHQGEILGVAALDGQGQDELFEALAGVRRLSSGEIEIGGKRVSLRSPFDAVRRGIAFVPSDRQEALLPQQSVAHNLTAPRHNRVSRWGWISARKEQSLVDQTVEELQIDTRAGGAVSQLSGGNQQKVTIGRWIASGFDVLLTFDPTRGIDARTKQQIYVLLRHLSEEGRSVLFFTSELRELQLMADRVLVMYGGEVVGELVPEEATEQRVLELMHGLSSSGREASA